MYFAARYFAPEYFAPVYWEGAIPTVPVYPPVLPNPRRTLVIKIPGWLDSFPAMWANENDVVTFDLSRLLSSDETLETIKSFSLSVAQSSSGTDPTPSDRGTGIPAISGSTVSQRFGGWQQDVAFVKYLATVKATTSYGSTIIESGYLPVYALSG
jgi:hypothetical protein